MANTDDLDDFFKKKDRKGSKPKKQTGILTNPKELLKQLEIVTSATSAFRENPELDEEDEEGFAADETQPAVAPTAPVHHPPKGTTAAKIEPVPLTLAKDGPQDEWEEFEQSNAKYEELRAKFSRANDQEEFDRGSDHSLDADEGIANAHEREQQKDKQVWKVTEAKANDDEGATKNVVVEETRPVSPVKAAAPSSSGSTYRPPHLRSGGGTAVTIVSGLPSSGATKKKQPNIASTEEFPTLGATVNKK